MNKTQLTLIVICSVAISSLFLLSFTPTAYAQAQQEEPSYSMPAWFKGVTISWSQGEITDEEFGKSLEVLIGSGIIKVKSVVIIEVPPLPTIESKANIQARSSLSMDHEMSAEIAKEVTKELEKRDEAVKIKQDKTDAQRIIDGKKRDSKQAIEKAERSAASEKVRLANEKRAESERAGEDSLQDELDKMNRVQAERERLDAEKDRREAEATERASRPSDNAKIIEFKLDDTKNGCQADPSCYVPYTIQINKGESVAWVNADNTYHIVYEGNINNHTNDSKFHSDMLRPGDYFEKTFEESGTFEIFCTYHPWQTGTVVVR